MNLFTFLITGIIAYPIVALALVFWPFSKRIKKRGYAVVEFEDFVHKLENEATSNTLIRPSESSFFEARDGARRLYRLYPGTESSLLIFLHGSGSDSRYLARLAHELTQLPNGPTVATLDMRGHGPEPGRRGDVDHVHQQEQDIADLWGALKKTHRFDHFFLGGHSIGGGLSIRYAAGNEQPKPDGLVLIAPFIHWKSPVARSGSGGWAIPCIPRFAGIEMLRRFSIHAFEKQPVLRFAISEAIKDGSETPLYSWRLYKSVTPRDKYNEDIARIKVPVLVIAAEKDSIFNSDGYKDVFKNLKQSSIKVIAGINHFQLSTADEVPKLIGVWLQMFLNREPNNPISPFTRPELASVKPVRKSLQNSVQ